MTELHHERVRTCHPLVAAKAYHFLDLASSAGHTLLIVRAWSSVAEQMGIYQIGRTQDVATGDWKETGSVRTKAKPGLSAHNVMTKDHHPASMAFDVIALDQTGHPLWQVVNETPEQNDVRWLRTYGRRSEAVWTDLYKLMAKCGLDAYGDTWGASLAWDKGHCEEPAWKLTLDPLNLMMPTVKADQT